MSKDTPRRRIRWTRRLLALCVGVVLALLLGELALRAVGFSAPLFFQWDDVAGSAHIPGAEGWWTQEGKAYVRINSRGLRDREHAKEKAAGTFRIAVLGDSYAEAFQVPLEEAAWSVMADRLARRPVLSGSTVEVLNFGVSGYGTAQELRVLRHEVWDYSPDLVLLMVCTGNDVRNNSRALEQDPNRPYFRLRDGELELDDAYLEASGNRFRRGVLAGAIYRMTKYSRLLQLAVEAYGRVRMGARRGGGRASTGERDAASATGVEVGLDAEVYRAPTDERWQESWRVTEALIARMAKEVEAKGARFLVASLSNGIQVHPDAATRRAFCERLGVDDLFYPERRLEALGRDAGIPVVTLARPLLAHAREHGAYLHGFGDDLGRGHWNPEGHRLAGEILAEAVAGLLAPY